MRIRLLGTSAGGGFPQWNCRCVVCRAARSGNGAAIPRTQSSIALSADGLQWFLINASPDVRQQIESFPPLLGSSSANRSTGIEGVLLTNADLDHTLGLFILREGSRLVVHATPAVRRALSDGVALDGVLANYCGIEWREPPTNLTELTFADGSPSGLSYRKLPLSGKPPRYFENHERMPEEVVGYSIEDATSGRRVVILPDLGELDGDTLETIRGSDAVLLDGTFWRDDELAQRGVGTTTAARMGHLPISGPSGSLARTAGYAPLVRVFTHINNTNPILLENSPERAVVEAAGWRVGYDGMEFEL